MQRRPPCHQAAWQRRRYPFYLQLGMILAIGLVLWAMKPGPSGDGTFSVVIEHDASGWVPIETFWVETPIGLDELAPSKPPRPPAAPARAPSVHGHP